MVRTHQAILDRNLPGDEVDQAAVNEVRADPPRPLFMKNEALALDARQAADARSDRNAGAEAHRFVHVGKASILDRLAGRIDAVDDEGINLTLDLMVHTLGRIEAIFMVGRLHFARDATFLVAGIEMRDPPRAALA